GLTLPQRPCRLRGQAAVLVGGLVTGLPWTVHLVAQTPQLDVERFGEAVSLAQVRPVGAPGVVRVLPDVERLLDPPGAEVHRVVRLDPGLAAPRDELADPMLVGLQGVPGDVESLRATLAGTDAVLPSVAGH